MGASRTRGCRRILIGFSIPISLFIFGWTCRASVHWIVPTIGTGLYFLSNFSNPGSSHLPLSYQRYAGSVIAGNDFFRSSTAAASPIFRRAYFKSLGIGRGVHCLRVWRYDACVPSLDEGPQLRALSKYGYAPPSFHSLLSAFAFYAH